MSYRYRGARGFIVDNPFYVLSDQEFNGMLRRPGPCGTDLAVIFARSLDDGWEHVSVSTARRCPNWQEMCWVKALFWDDEDTVVQLHVQKSKHINIHPYVLHMWRNERHPYPLPPESYV